MIEQGRNAFWGYLHIQENSTGLWAGFTGPDKTSTTSLPVYRRKDGRLEIPGAPMGAMALLGNYPDSRLNVEAVGIREGENFKLLLTPVW